MRDVAIVAFAHAAHTAATPGTTNGVEMLVPVFAECYRQTGLNRLDIDFWCSGSSDYLAGRAFSFISAVDSIGAVPPINESHVEADAAWALYEAWLKIASGEAETALVYGFGKASAGDADRTLALQLDPYAVAPLWPGARAVAALQARAGLDAGVWSERDLAEVAARVHGRDADELLAEPVTAAPLRAHDCPPVTDGAAAVILASADRARDLCARPAVIAGIAHLVDPPALGARDLTRSPSTAGAAERAFTMSGRTAADVDVAELHTPFGHQEIIVRDALDLGDGVAITPSGGAQRGNPLFSAGLERFGYAAAAIWDGVADVAVAHATSGPALQQNLVGVLEGADR